MNVPLPPFQVYVAPPFHMAPGDFCPEKDLGILVDMILH